ncbi:GntR family transcriptional regulator [Alicyclobacillus acidocaldarius]|uniref:Transcriptional regulator, GntR family n=1 Tax=Alicyclobacillus acidocaldarius (strain Tc-4-1) TaxID=1048834 RepID=F8IGU3_ALIAT|nr:GntR family transcriptional regulator [Alicyclobacillus acidocaldarius]AEJ43107.1 transcriptional regulator, GntR family [Alicyclobacillus acidocaldarius subsp. acidocaldarius Tc-4-1]
MTLDPPWHPPAWELDPSQPLYEQIAHRIRIEIAAARLPSGTRLPSVRDLAAHLRVTPNTVMRAYADLEQDGLLETFRGQGTFVARARDVIERARWRIARQAYAYVQRVADDLGMTAEELLQLGASLSEGDDAHANGR